MTTEQERGAVWFTFLSQKYVQRADARQQSMGLQYTEAETHDLAKECARFAGIILKSLNDRIAQLEGALETGAALNVG